MFTTVLSTVATQARADHMWLQNNTQEGGPLLGARSLVMTLNHQTNSLHSFLTLHLFGHEQYLLLTNWVQASGALETPARGNVILGRTLSKSGTEFRLQRMRCRAQLLWNGVLLILHPVVESRPELRAQRAVDASSCNDGVRDRACQQRMADRCTSIGPSTASVV